MLHLAGVLVDHLGHALKVGVDLAALIVLFDELVALSSHLVEAALKLSNDSLYLLMVTLLVFEFILKHFLTLSKFFNVARYIIDFSLQVHILSVKLI